MALRPPGCDAAGDMSPEYDAFGRPIRTGSGDGASSGPAPSAGGGGTRRPADRRPRAADDDERDRSADRPDDRAPDDRPGGVFGGGPPSGDRPGAVFGAGAPSGGEPASVGGASPAVRAGCGCASSLVALVVVLGIAGVAIFSAVGDEDSGIRGALTAIDDLTRDGDGDGLSAAGTRREVTRLRAELRPGERLVSLTLRADYLSARAAIGEGAPTRTITLYADRDPSISEGGTSSDRGVPLEDLDLDGPARLIAATRRGLGPRSTATADYVVLDLGTDDDDPPGWALYLDGAAQDELRWTGDVHGRHVLRAADGAPAPAAGQAGPARVPTGIAGGSMVRPANLRRALDAVRKAAPSGSLVTGVDVRPVRIGVSTRKGYRERRYTVDAAFGLDAAAPGETTQRNGIAFSAVNARGPERALRRIQSRAGNRATGRVDYVLLSLPTPGFAGQRSTWGVYLAGGSPVRRYWRASLDGRRAGEPGTPQAP